MNTSLMLLGSLIIIFVTVFAIDMTTSRSASLDLIEKLNSSQKRQAGTVAFDQLSHLPPPVLRYFRHVLKEGQKEIRWAHIKQRGRLRTNTKTDKWMAFEAEEYIAPLAPGFFWNAKAYVAPLIHVRVFDSYQSGSGSGDVWLLSAFKMSAADGGPEMNSGALHRYFAEAPWYPTALLPQAGVRWEPISEFKARAILADRGTEVSLDIGFNETGELVSIYSAGRWGSFDEGYKKVPWEGHFRNYVEVSGMKVPSEGEVGWYDGNEWKKVWEGKIIESVFEL